MQREGHAVDRRAVQPQHRRRHRQLNPGAGAGQVAGAVVRGAAVGAAQRQQVFAPVSTLLPAATGAGAVPLQHQRARWLLGVEADPGEQRFARRHRKRRGGAVEKVLVQAGHQRTAVAAAGRWFTPGRQRLALDRLRVVLVGGHRRGLAAQGMGQHRAAPAQALAQAQRARAVQKVTRQGLAKQRGYQLGEQQARLPALQRHRHQQAHGLGGVQVERGQAGAGAHRQVELVDRHRRGIDIEAGREKIAAPPAGVEGIARQQPHRRQPAAEGIGQFSRRWRRLTGAGDLLGQLFDLRLPQRGQARLGDTTTGRGTGRSSALQAAFAAAATLAHDAGAVQPQRLAVGGQRHQGQRQAPGLPGQGLARRERRLGLEHLPGPGVALLQRTDQRPAAPFTRPDEPEQAHRVGDAPVLERRGVGDAALVAGAALAGVHRIERCGVDADRLQQQNAQLGQRGGGGRQQRTQRRADAAFAQRGGGGFVAVFDAAAVDKKARRRDHRHIGQPAFQRPGEDQVFTADGQAAAGGDAQLHRGQAAGAGVE